VAHIPNPVERQLTLDRVAPRLIDRLKVPEANIRRRMIEISGASNRRRNARQTDHQEIPAREELPANEKELMTVCLQEPTLFSRLAKQLAPGDFTHEGIRRIFIAATESINGDGRMESTVLATKLATKIAQNGDPALLASLMSDESGCTAYTDRFEGCLAAFKQHRAQQRVSELKVKIAQAAEAGDKESQRRLYNEMLEIRGILDNRGGNQ